MIELAPRPAFPRLSVTRSTAAAGVGGVCAPLSALVLASAAGTAGRLARRGGSFAKHAPASAADSRPMTSRVSEHAVDLEEGRSLLDAIDAADLVAWSWNLRTGLVERRGALAARLGLDSCRRGNDDLMSRLDGANRRAIRSALVTALREDEPFNTVLAVRGEDDERHWLAVQGRVTRRRNGRPTRLAGLLRDITGERRAHEAVSRLSAVLAAIVENTTAVVFVKDQDGRYTLMNPEMESLWGRPRSELLGHTDYELFPAAVADRLRRNDRQVLRSGRTLEVEERVEFGGVQRIYRVSKVPLRGEGDEPYALCGVATDITDRIQLEETLRRQAAALEEADRRKNEFLALLGHELRNPLAPILAAAELLEREQEGMPDEVRNAAAVIGRQTYHLARLVEDLLDVGRITRGAIELRRRPLTIDRAIERAVEAVQPLVRERRHDLRVDLPAQPLWVEADPTRLAQIIGNLLHNAATYTQRGGKLRVEAAERGGEVLVRVSDNGPGIPEDLLATIFEPFRQKPRALDRSQGGLGLGLTLVRLLVELHGGRVEAHSEGTEQGSVFELALPRSEAPAGEAADDRESSMVPAAGPLRILVVDDNRDSADILAQLLRSDGHRVKIAYRGAEALATVADWRPAVALLDIGLPEMDGFEVARHLRQLWEDVLLIAVTGYGHEEARRQVKDAGFDHHLLKPVKYDELRGLLAEVCARG